jgi:hypothetical protein
MTLAWADFIVDGAELLSFLEDPHTLPELTLRSCTLVRWGPSIVLRLDVNPRYLRRMAGDWREPGMALQFHLQFLDVAEFQMDALTLPEDVKLNVATRERSRLNLIVEGAGTAFSFSCSAQLRAGRFSAYVDTGLEGARRVFFRRLDQMRYRELPATTDKVYYERI